MSQETEHADPGAETRHDADTLKQRIARFLTGVRLSDLLSASAVVISVIAVYISYEQQAEAQALRTDRLYFGSYRVGQHLQETIDPYLVEKKRLTDASLRNSVEKLIVPIEYSLGVKSALQSNTFTVADVDDATPGGPSDAESLYWEAAVAKYDDRNVIDAFNVGRETTLLTYAYDHYAKQQPKGFALWWQHYVPQINQAVVDGGFVKTGFPGLFVRLAESIKHSLFNTAAPCNTVAETPSPNSTKEIASSMEKLHALPICLFQQWGVNSP
jgi:hypothetical protein